ncbi:MAG: immunoglobulin domain-containing protein, partial [Phycisphaerae bacterium]
EAPPFISDQPDNADICESGSVQFSVTAVGTGPFSYQWFKDGEEVISFGDTLFINGAGPADEGTYYCEISNAFGTSTSEDAVLDVITLTE